MSKKSITRTAITLFFISIFSISAPAEEPKPIQLSIFNPIQLYSEDTDIKGVRLSLLYGKNKSVTGLDLGFVNHNTSGLSKGFQHGFVGIVEEDFVGFQNNFINSTKGNFEGFQWGLVNHAHNMNGFQLGLVNYAGTMKGLQIGLVNVIKQNGQFPVFPIVNWSF